MEIKFSSQNILEQKLDLVFYPVLQDAKQIKSLLLSLGLKNSLDKKLAQENFLGKKGEHFSFEVDDVSIVLLGTGKEKKLLTDDVREFSGLCAQFLKKNNIKSIGVDIQACLRLFSDLEVLAQSFAEGFYLGGYSFDKYKTTKDLVNQADVLVFSITNDKKKAFEKFWQKGLLFAQGTILARDLVNEPAAYMTPTLLAQTAQNIASQHKEIKVKILDKEQVEKLGMHAYLGVDRGSDEPLKFIHLTYLPKAKTKEKIALVGKGITFDSGGLNIKVGDGMTDMKIDMGGAATVLGVFQVLASLNIKAEVHGIIAACENMPSGKALRPGDVVTNMQGKTIEIANTDAEGRVTLADALAYAQKQKVGTIVDLATLTGACIVALGSEYAALYANKDGLTKDLLASADTNSEKIWHMPLAPEYKELNKSQVADIRNLASSRGGGSITAALFLQEFILEDVAWAHLDIAGPAYAEKALNHYTPVGGVGFAVRTLLTWLQSK